MSGGAQEPAKDGDPSGPAEPLLIRDQLTSLIMGVEVQGAMGVVAYDAVDPSRQFVAHSLAETIAAIVWPVIEAIVADRGGDMKVSKALNAKKLEELAGAIQARHSVRAEDRDPSRHQLAPMSIETLSEIQARARTNQEFRERRNGDHKYALAEVRKSFEYHAPKGDQPQRYEWLRRESKDLAIQIMDFCPESRERSLAITHLEQAVMWANKAIAVNE